MLDRALLEHLAKGVDPLGLDPVREHALNAFIIEGSFRALYRQKEQGGKKPVCPRMRVAHRGAARRRQIPACAIPQKVRTPS
jgi:hypothetical protein